MWKIIPLVVAAFVGLIIGAGCRQQPRQPSEIEAHATAILSETFVGDAENWYAIEKVGGKSRLTELHHPKMSLIEQNVSETDRMNGVSERAKLVVTCTQFRWFDGSWSEWKAGTGGNGLIGEMMTVLVADWGVRLEKKNGQWTSQPAAAAHNFQRDRALLARMMSEAPR